MPNVAFEHPDYKAAKPLYEIIDDCVAGEARVKFRRTKYLPMPNAADRSLDNQARYDAYITRAVFMNVTRRTQAGLVGAVFESPPVVKVPTELEDVLADASGGGVSMEQLANKAVGHSLSKGRLGLFVDYPDTTSRAVTKADDEKLRPNITVYDALDIINWRVQEINGKDMLTLVVVKEPYITSDDGFEAKKSVQYREMRLTAEGTIIKIWRSSGKIAVTPVVQYMPTDFNGNRLMELPFKFVGSENNDADIDDPPMYDMASLNIAHYRNSADYEEAVYMVGQPTPYFTGLTEDWVKNVLKGEVQLGSRAAVPLPVDASAGLLQVESNGLSHEAMEQKEAQMAALGARLVQQSTVERTASEAIIDDKGDNSILASCARNVTDGIQWALRYCLKFVRAAEPSKDEIQYRLATTYGLSSLPPDELANVTATWQAGGISWTEYRERLRHGGLATQDDDAAKAEIDTEQKARDQREADKANRIAEGAAKAQAKFPKPQPKTTTPGSRASNRGRAAK